MYSSWNGANENFNCLAINQQLLTQLSSKENVKKNIEINLTLYSYSGSIKKYQWASNFPQK